MSEQTVQTCAVTGVLPLSISGAHDGHDVERAKILMASVSYFNRSNTIKEVIIIVDKYESSEIRQLRNSAKDVALHFLHEYDVEPRLAYVIGLHGWKKQQILKLSAHRFVRTSFYLTLDADIVCIKPLEIESFLRDRRGVIQRDAKLGLSSAFNRVSWWLASAKVLRTAPRLFDRGVAVTPFLFSREACGSMTTHIAALNGFAPECWIDALFIQRHSLRTLSEIDFRDQYIGWTEYALYTLYLEKMKSLHNYHFDSSLVGATAPQLLSRDSFGFFGSDRNFQNWPARRCFSSEDAGLFLAIQSRAKVSPREIRIGLTQKPSKAMDSGARDEGIPRGAIS